MSNALIAFFVAAPAAFWIYPKIINKTGGNTNSALVVAAIAGVFIFFCMLIIISLLPS